MGGKLPSRDTTLLGTAFRSSRCRQWRIWQPSPFPTLPQLGRIQYDEEGAFSRLPTKVPASAGLRHGALPSLGGYFREIRQYCFVVDGILRPAGACVFRPICLNIEVITALFTRALFSLPVFPCRSGNVAFSQE